MRIKIKIQRTAKECFEDFLLAKKGSGAADKTLKTYHDHFVAAGKHMDWNKNMDSISMKDINQMVASLRDHHLSPRTIASYMTTIKVFFSWAREEHMTTLNIPLYKCEDGTKDTYTDEELSILLEKPNPRKCPFSEYRNWVIINFLLNSGCRAATIRNIKIADVDLSSGLCYFRHTKNKKAQISPLCAEMRAILKEYLKIRHGSDDDYLFPNEYNEQMTENGLRCAIERYNRSRGIEKTSIHMFRHTFAKKYLLDCGGNAFTLQKLLGHSSLEMTQKYCAIFNADIMRNYDEHSPLAQIQHSRVKIKH